MTSILKHFLRTDGKVDLVGKQIAKSHTPECITVTPALPSFKNIAVPTKAIPTKYVFGAIFMIGMGFVGYRIHTLSCCRETDSCTLSCAVDANIQKSSREEEDSCTTNFTYPHLGRKINVDTISRSMLPCIFRRTFLHAQSHELSTKTAQATTILLEQHEHTWFKTLCELSKQQAIVGLTIHVPATIVVEQNVYTVNRWLDVEIRRKPFSAASRISVWNDEAFQETDEESLEDSSANTFMCLIRQSVQSQFEHINCPLPNFKIYVRNGFCKKSRGDHYGLRTASHISGILGGLVLSFTDDTIMYDSLNSLSTVVGDLCMIQNNAEGQTDEDRVPSQSVRARIDAALWDTTTDYESDAGSNSDLDSDKDITVLLAVNGHIQSTTEDQPSPFTHSHKTRLTHILYLFAQHHVQLEASNIKITDDNIITIITCRESASHVQETLKLICEEHSYSFVDHGTVCVHKSSSPSDPLQQTWISSVDVV